MTTAAIIYLLIAWGSFATGFYLAERKQRKHSEQMVMLWRQSYYDLDRVSKRTCNHLRQSLQDMSNGK